MKFLSIVIVYLTWISIHRKNSVKGELTKVIETDKGPVRGEILKTILKSSKYSAFKGIPFAKPPINELRFKPPVEADAWSDVINATSEPPSCFQVNTQDNLLRGSEDCLYLNIFTPKTKFDLKNDSLLAVMVWIYGGGFREGLINTSFYGPDWLIEDGVIVVAMNYRLGPLGFLSLNHPNATGNMGLKDQVLALKWVQKNVEKFGGDPKRVTIFGQSAGSASVSFHQISEASTDLFNASIAMSGSALNPWAFHSPTEAVSRAFLFGRYLGIETLSKEKLLKELHQIAPDILTREAAIFTKLDTLFKPTIENETIAVDVFLSDCPYRKYKNGKLAKKSVILGIVEYETLVLEQDSQAMKNISSFMSNILGIDSNTTEEIMNETTSAFIYNAGIDQMQQYIAKNGAPVYYYKNCFDHYASLHRFLGYNLNGTSHADDLLHIFWPSILSSANESTDPNNEINIQRKKMARMWTNFAKYFNPTPYGKLDELLNVTWLPSGSSGQHLRIGQDKLEMQPSRPVNGIVKKLQTAIESFNGMLNGCFFI